MTGSTQYTRPNMFYLRIEWIVHFLLCERYNWIELYALLESKWNHNVYISFIFPRVVLVLAYISPQLIW